jgi:hypothetical protein
MAGPVAETVSFAAGAVGILQLDVTNSAAFTGTLSGLALGDTIDFANAMIADAAIVGNTLTVDLLDGQTVAINLAGPLPNGDALQIELDGQGGGELVVVNAAFDNGPGAVNVDAGHKLTLTDGATVAGTPIDNFGTVEVAGPATLNGVAFSNLGMLQVDSDATLTLAATTVSNATDADTNTGSVYVAADGVLKLDNATIQFGTVTVALGGEVETVSGTNNEISTPNGPVDLQAPPKHQYRRRDPHQRQQLVDAGQPGADQQHRDDRARLDRRQDVPLFRPAISGAVRWWQHQARWRGRRAGHHRRHAGAGLCRQPGQSEQRHLRRRRNRSQHHLCWSDRRPFAAGRAERPRDPALSRAAA